MVVAEPNPFLLLLIIWVKLFFLDHVFKIVDPPCWPIMSIKGPLGFYHLVGWRRTIYMSIYVALKLALNCCHSPIFSSTICPQLDWSPTDLCNTIKKIRSYNFRLFIWSFHSEPHHPSAPAINTPCIGKLCGFNLSYQSACQQRSWTAVTSSKTLCTSNFTSIRINLPHDLFNNSWNLELDTLQIVTPCCRVHQALAVIFDLFLLCWTMVTFVEVRIPLSGTWECELTYSYRA